MNSDEDLLKQVLVNLIGNAFTHNPSGTKITVQLTERHDGILLSVSDDGPGIDEEHIPYLFDRLYMASSDRSGGGHGLGLTISKRIVELLGGTIAVESSEQGSTFHVRFFK
jgi:signal transduction histidine kinase